MTGIEVIENGISKVRKYLSILESYRDKTTKDLASDITLKGTVERYLYLAVQATIDLGEAIISYKGFRKPSTFAESFKILQENKLISKTLEEKMARMTGFRNWIAHDYGDIDHNILHDILLNRLKDIEDFLDDAKKNL
ncbi:MAG: DUF86 domain-containing protein [Candidatus Humimicrobiaceae bacterium]